MVWAWAPILLPARTSIYACLATEIHTKDDLLRQETFLWCWLGLEALRSKSLRLPCLWSTSLSQAGPGNISFSLFFQNLSLLSDLVLAHCLSDVQCILIQDPHYLYPPLSFESVIPVGQNFACWNGRAIVLGHKTRSQFGLLIQLLHIESSSIIFMV